MSNNKSEHILNASTSLVGFSFIAVTSLRTLNLIHTTHVDEFAATDVIIFVFSTILSFLSIRTSNDRWSLLYEKIAEYIFLLGLLVILLMVLLIEFSLI